VQLSRDTSAIVISRLDQFFVQLLERIPSAADPKGSRSAQDRVFSSPADKSDEEFIREWRSYVEPGLHHLFQDAIATVSADLKAMQRDKLGDRHDYLLQIPFTHIDAWLNALNQARLVLASRHHFTEKELESSIPLVFSSDRDIALFQIHFYAFLQELLLQEMS
jgi:Domain of unknown function (DUF2017)